MLEKGRLVGLIREKAAMFRSTDEDTVLASMQQSFME